MKNEPVREAIKRLHELPTLPSSLAQILDAANDPEVSALDLGKFIAADQALSASVLRIVNSAYYGFHRQISSVTTAIVILGFQEVKNLVLAASAIRAFPLEHGGFDLRDLWRHALAAGMASERASRLSRQPLSNGTFIAGLLHDIGKVALVIFYPEIYGGMLSRPDRDSGSLMEEETAAFGCTHAEIGALLAEQWELPDALIEAIRLHHDPARAAIEPRLAQSAQVGDYIAYAAGLGIPAKGSRMLPELAVNRLGLTAEHIQHVRDKIAEARTSIDDLIGMMHG